MITESQLKSLQEQIKSRSYEDGSIIVSPFQPDKDEMDERAMIVHHFSLGYVTAQKPRPEFNDLALVNRATVDKMNFNIYLPNDGDPNEADIVNSWRAIVARPTIRNKATSICAHATAELAFPKVFAYNDQSQSQEDAADVMKYLIEWSADQSGYESTALKATMTAMFSPASIVHTQYQKVMRKVKLPKDGGGWEVKEIEDKELSGYQDTPVTVDELFIENPFQENIQLQGWLIWRRVLSFSVAETKYGVCDNFQHVTPGMHLIYNDPNQTFYQVYDTNLTTELVEEVQYWNRNLDIYQVLVNGVPMYPVGNPNPRQDKQFPFIKFGYERIDEGRFFWYKSLASKLKQDSELIDSAYAAYIDGANLAAWPATVSTGSEVIGADAVIPGAVTTLSSPDAKITTISPTANLNPLAQAMSMIDTDINQSSQEPNLAGSDTQGANPTAYQISQQGKNAAIVLGLFGRMIAEFVRQYGALRMGDILQYMTVVDTTKITDNPGLVYRNFLHTPKVAGSKAKRLKFDPDLPTTPITQKQKLKLSFDTLEQEDDKEDLFGINPEFFRNLEYQIRVEADAKNPLTEELKRAFKLEIYDRAIANPLVQQNPEAAEKVFKEFLLGAYPDVITDVDEFLPSNPMQGMMDPMMMAGQAGTPNLGTSTLPQALSRTNAIPR